MTHLLEFPKAIKDIASRDSYVAALMQEYDRKAIGLMELIELTIIHLDGKSRTQDPTGSERFYWDYPSLTEVTEENHEILP
jgi:hypothetical protein